jgi:hypothetical protein
MTVSAYAQQVQETLSKQLQSLYNLNWKNRSGRPDGKTYQDGPVKIDFWPTALDYTVGSKTMQVKWDVVENTVINITFPHEEHLEALSKFLKKYLWGTE